MTRPHRHVRSPGRWLGTALVYLLCLLVALLTLIPLVWMILGSLKSADEVVAYPPTFLPHHFAWHNYVEVFTTVPFGRYILNTFFVATSVTVVALLFHSMAAYALARLKFRGRDALFLGIVATLMIPFSVTLIPTFILVKSLGWLDTYWALIIPAIPNAFGIFLLRQFYLGLPVELEEAARLDGATPAGIFWRIALPMSQPILATLATFFFLANWNAYLWPLIVTQNPNMRVTQVALAAFSGEHSTSWQLIMAGATVAALPGLLLYLFLQRYLIEGIKLSGLK
ncbi:carbohydrate ABC transporter permease [Deinococcus metallilatus]|uniref:carbohydrate ABC transporter permease n=1 Tax=Deinococcus metallilatus TaxID=1211322 RepID=UPI0020172C60|nr:carbohydrate ABC transporter permease [Deinococcus metallilatus]